MNVVQIINRQLPSNNVCIYAAGYFDGEGCIRVTYSTGYGIHVFITNTYRPYLEELQKYFGGKVTLRNHSNEKHRTQFQWRISNKIEALFFLKAICPFVKEKYKQVALGIEFCSFPKYHSNRWYVSNPEIRDRKIKIKEELIHLKKIDYGYQYDKTPPKEDSRV